MTHPSLSGWKRTSRRSVPGMSTSNLVESTRHQSPLNNLEKGITEQDNIRPKRPQSIASLLNSLPKSKNYNRIRDAYRIQKQSERQQNPGNYLISSLLAVVDIRTYYRIAKAVVTSELFDVGITLMDLVSDLLFCILYLVDIQWALSDTRVNDPALSQLPPPSWLWISRPKETQVISFGFSVYNIFSWILAVTFSDNQLAAIFTLRTLLICICSVPFLIGIYIERAKYLYIPYFLMAITGVDRLRKVLRLRGAVPWLDFSNVMEKAILLGGTLMAIAYVALCLFQYVEFRFASPSHTLSVMEAFYFVVATLSTVGYGDVTPQSKEGEGVVILIILTTLAVVPYLISSLVETMAQQAKGSGGYYRRGKLSYVVVLGNFQHAARFDDVLTELLSDSHERLNVVVMGRTPPSPALISIMVSYKYKNRISYLVGSGMDQSDLERAQVRHASAVYILADRGAQDRCLEDEQNTLRAWAVHAYAPEVLLFVNNMLPDTQSYQEMTTDSALCVDDVKQLALGLTVMYDGASTLLINLLRASVCNAHFPNQWQSLYDDGQKNKIQFVNINPIFVGMKFSDASWYCYKEFQLTLIAVRIHSDATDTATIVLNPGAMYRLKNSDELIFVAYSTNDVDMFLQLTQDQFNITKKDCSAYEVVGPPTHTKSDACVTEPSLVKRIMTAKKSSSKQITKSSDSELNLEETFILAIPEPSYHDPHVPVCQILCSKSSGRMIIDSAESWREHLLVCTGNYDVFKFVCGLRASHLEKHIKVLFLAESVPTLEELDSLSVFHDVFFMIGDPKKKKALLKAGIVQSRKVVIMNFGTTATDDDFAGSGAIMIQHLIYQMFDEMRLLKCVILDVPKRSHINFLHPSPTTMRVSYGNLLKTAVNIVGKSFRKGRASNTLGRPKEESLVSVKEKSYNYTPIFASGRVVSASMLDSILFQLYRSPCILELFLMLCGVGGEKVDVRLAELNGVSNSWIGQVKMPHKFDGRTYEELYCELAINQGIIPLGIYRDVDIALDNKLPIVITNPVPGMICCQSDLVFVLSP